MFLRLTLPTGTTIDSDINVNGFNFTQIYYNELQPADDSIKMQVPFTVEISNALKSFVNENIKAVVYGESEPVFTGYVRKDSTAKKSIRNDDISVELVPPSFLMNEVYGYNRVFQNTSVGTILSEVFQDKGYDFTIMNVPSQVIKFSLLEENTNVKSFVQQILYECGYTYTFTADGRFNAVPLFNKKPEVITQNFYDGVNGNMWGTYTQKSRERSVNAITATFNEIEYKENQVIFDDTSARTINPGNYLFGNANGEYLKYDCDGVQSILYVDNASVVISSDKETISTTFRNWYTKGLLTAFNDGNFVVNVSRIKVTGSGWFVISTSQSKTAEGNNKKDISLKYTFDSETAEELVKNVVDYYKYSSIKLLVKSKADFGLGSFCTVTAEGAGQYTCRIIKKTYVLTSDIIEYELESVLEYTPAVSTTDTEHASNTGNFYDIISADNNISPAEKHVLKKEYLTIIEEQQNISVKAESTGVITSTQYAEYIAAYLSLKDYIDANGIFDAMDTITHIDDREVFNDLYTTYYALRDAINERITQAYIDAHGGNVGKDSIPVMNINAPVIAIKNANYENQRYSEYEPAEITFYSHMTNGSFSVPYMGVFEIYRNDDEVPVYKSNAAELGSSYHIPDDTYSLRLVMKDTLGQFVYDNELIDFVTPYSGTTLHLSNKYQSFYSGSITQTREGEGVYFETTVSAYNGIEKRPFSIREFPAVQGMSFRTDGSTIKIFPTGEIEDAGVIDFSAFIEVTEGRPIGMNGKVIGINNKVIGLFKGQTNTVTFTYSNLDVEVTRYGIANYSGKYKGPVNYILNIPVGHVGDYFLWTGESIDFYKKGITYKYNGITWVEDESKEHQMASLTDMLDLIDSTTDGSSVALLLVQKLVANSVFVKNLFSKEIIIDSDGSISSSDWGKGKTGFKISSNSVEIESGVFRGSIEAGPLEFSKKSPGVVTISESGISVFDFCESLLQKGLSNGTFYCSGVYDGFGVSQFEYKYTVSETSSQYTNVYWADGSYYKSTSFYSWTAYYYYVDTYRTDTTTTNCKLVIGDTVVCDGTFTKKTVTLVNREKKIEYDKTYNSKVDLVMVRLMGSYPSTRWEVWSCNSSGSYLSKLNDVVPAGKQYNEPSIGTINITLNDSSQTFRLTNLPSYNAAFLPGTVYVTGDGTLKVKQ